MSGKKQKSIDRKIDVRGEERVVRQSWRANKTGLLLTSALLNKRTKQPLAGKLTALVADEVELLEVGRQHAEVFLQRAISRSSEIAGGAVGKRRRADIAVSNPMAAGLAGGTRRGDAAAAARKAEEEELEKHRADVMRMVEEDSVLKKRMTSLPERVTAEAAAVAAQNAATVRATAASLQTLQKNCKSTIGRNAYNTVLAAVAGAGGHTCDPGDPCDPAERCRPAEEPDGVTLVQRAEGLGVRPSTFRLARDRMHNARHDLAPWEALACGRYCYHERKERCDVTHSGVMDLARRIWHSDDVSRATGNSGNKDMWKESKAKDAPSHPRRQLMLTGDEVYKLFLKWPAYLALKEELLNQDSSFTDPGRSTFLSTRCGCLVEPKVSQCACLIHTQQKLYLDGLGFLFGAVHANCKCECSWCQGGDGCSKWAGMCRDVSNFSQALACEKVNLLEGDSDGGFEFWGRKPACAAMECSDCGFGKPNGIPTDCKALEHSAGRLVGWIRFEDQTMPDGKVHKKQQIPVMGTLGELWQEFMTHTKKAREHLSDTV